MHLFGLTDCIHGQINCFHGQINCIFGQINWIRWKINPVQRRTKRQIARARFWEEAGVMDAREKEREIKRGATCGGVAWECCWNVLLLRSCLGAARRALHCSYRSPSRAGASARRGVTAPTRMHGSAKLMRELQNLLPRADHTEVYA
jgi:hypothetical protein